MALSFGTLVFLSVGGVLALAVGANYRNTFDLLGAQSTLLVDAMEDALRAEMGARRERGGRRRATLCPGRVPDRRPGDGSRPFGRPFGCPGRNRAADLHARPGLQGGCAAYENNWRTDPAAPCRNREIAASSGCLGPAKQVNGRQWGAFVANEYGLFANVAAPLTRDGATRAWVIAAVRLQKLSEITQRTVFALWHSRLHSGWRRVGSGGPAVGRRKRA